MPNLSVIVDYLDSLRASIPVPQSPQDELNAVAAAQEEFVAYSKRIGYPTFHAWIGAKEILVRIYPTIRAAYVREISRMDSFLSELHEFELQFNAVDASIAQLIIKVEAKRNALAAAASFAAEDLSPTFERWVFTPARLYAGIHDITTEATPSNVVSFGKGAGDTV